MNVFLGLDPGYSGALAVIDRGSVELHPWPESEAAVWRLIDSQFPGEPRMVAVIEEVHSMPHDGVASAFKFGRHYGTLRAFLVAAGIPFAAVAPRTWQAAYGLSRHKGETRGAFKNRGRAIAQELYPPVRLTQKTADALLLAHYCKLHAPHLFPPVPAK